MPNLLFSLQWCAARTLAIFQRLESGALIMKVVGLVNPADGCFKIYAQKKH